MSSHRRGPWSQAEDAYLCQCVHTQGALNWVRIAQLIGSRSPKQCRERYHQNLKPSLNHEPISPEEGVQIERMVGEMGKRWAEIARRLHGRSDNAVKNWWNGSMNRRKRMMVRRRGVDHDLNYVRSVGPYVHDFQRAPFQDHEQINHHHMYSHYPQQSYTSSAPAHRQLHMNYVQQPYHATQHYNKSLLSPATSELSRSESTDHAPSLVSDNGSLYSASPRRVHSPNPEYSMHHGRVPDLRRSSIHAPQSASIGSAVDAYVTNMHVSARYAGLPVQSGEDYQSDAVHRNFQISSTYQPHAGQYTNELASHNRDDANLIQLPPLKPYSTSPSPQDNRMTLSSVLG